MNEWCFHGIALKTDNKKFIVLTYQAILYHVTNTTDMVSHVMNTTDMVSHVTNTTDTGKYQARWSSPMPICLYVLEVRVQYTIKDITWYENLSLTEVHA